MRDALVEDDERRATLRHELVLEVTFESRHNFYTGISQDLSVGGLFVATYSFLPVGECVRVRFTLPGSSELLDAITEVRWVRRKDTDEGEAGMGLEFLQLSPATRQLVKAFAERRNAIGYGR